MTRKALLIGAQTHGLTGVLNDVEEMARTLEPRAFRVTRLITPAATRAGILEAYEKLIADARPDDVFLVYYSGHGGTLDEPVGPDLRFIVPDDFADSSEDDFRGITGVELSVLVARLTDIALNTTVVIDCCHAAHMSRRLDLRVRSLLRPARVHPTYATVQRHVARLVDAGLPVHLRALISNPHAVRVVACAPAESAWEGTNRDGTPMGLFTDALCRTLRETDGLRVNWSTLINTVRRSVQELQPVQRPEAEGPAGRLPFATTDVEPMDTLPVAVVAPDRIQLLGAPLLGVEPGDEFTIMPAGATGPRSGPAIGTATVERLLPTTAVAQLRLDAGQSVPADARAHRTRTAAPPLPVRLPEDHPAAGELARAMTLRSLLRPGRDARIEVAADPQGRLVVRDEAGPLHPPYPATALGIGSIMDNLQRVAQATALRRLHGDPHRPLTHGVTIEWGRVRNGLQEPLALSGALLFAYADERIYLRLRNEGDQAMFVSLLNIGISSRIAVLTAADPGGIRLAKGATYTHGWNEDRQQLTGVPVTWPENTDTTAARPETVLALISDGPVDVSVLRQSGVRGLTAQPGGASELAGLLAQIAAGTSRDVGDAPPARVRYAVQPIDFTVSPTPPPIAEQPRFLVDDRPAQPVRLLSPRGAAPRRVAVRLDELVVPDRAPAGSGLRMDALVLTGGSDGPDYRAETRRSGEVDDVLLFHGPAVDFLDIALWISGDPAGSLPLWALLEQRSTGLPPAGPAVGAVAMEGACAALINAAAEQLTGVADESTGLYRTSLLAPEQFGIGRHQRHLPDFTLTFTVTDVA